MAAAMSQEWRGADSEDEAFDEVLQRQQEALSIPEGTVVYQKLCAWTRRALEKLQNDLQMAALVSALPALVFAALHITPEAKDANIRVAAMHQQNSPSRGIEEITGPQPPSPPVIAGSRLATMADLRRRVFYWLQDEKLRMPNLISSVIRSGKELQNYYNRLHAWATGSGAEVKTEDSPAAQLDETKLRAAVEKVVK